MSMFLEDATWMIVVGILAEAMLGFAYINTRKKVFGLVMVGVLLLAAGGVALEWFVVTDRESVEATLYTACDLLEENDLEWLLEECVSKEALRTRQRAAWALGLVEVTKAKIGNLKITVNRLASPPTAEAQFLGTIHFEDQSGRIPYRHYAARFRVILQLEDGRWVITDHVEEQGAV